MKLAALVTAVAVLVVAAGIATVSPTKAGATAQKNTAQKNIVRTAVAAGQFKTLVSLVKAAGLAGALSGPGRLTVFAPTDAAFAKVPKAALAALAKDKAKLKAVLLYHVVKGKVTAGQVVELKSAKTLEGGSLSIRVAGGKVYVNGARVTTPDVMASNGVIHVINKVLIPPAM
jgi:uncharacterized surface protein with fasciclin (FAS1) repeats